MLQVIAPTGVVTHRERAADREFDDAGSIPACESPICGSTCPSSFSDGPLIMGYLVKSRAAGRAGSNPAQSGDRLFPISLFVRRGFFDESQDWVIVDNDEVAGSSPASGSNAGVTQG